MLNYLVIEIYPVGFRGNTKYKHKKKWVAGKTGKASTDMFEGDEGMSMDAKNYYNYLYTRISTKW